MYSLNCLIIGSYNLSSKNVVCVYHLLSYAQYYMKIKVNTKMQLSVFQ
jgi:hypothetical protein